MENISFEDFAKLEIRVGRIMSAERVEGSDKLLKLIVDFGETSTANLPAGRQVIAGIGKVYEPEGLVGKECPFAFNLEPKMLKGLESQGMILCASTSLSTGPSMPALLHPDKEVPPGSLIK